MQVFFYKYLSLSFIICVRKFQDFLFFLDFPFWQIPLFSPMMDGTGRSDTAGKIEESQELFLIVV